MISSKPRVAAVTALFLLLAVSCAGTKFTQTTVNKDVVEKPYSDLLIIGIAHKDKQRRLFEQQFVSQLRAAGVEAVASGDAIAIPADMELEKDTILKAVRKFGSDGVIITHVVAFDTDESVVRSGGSTSDYFNYYGTRYNAFHTAGYSRTTSKVRLQTRLYDVKTEKLVWSGRSKTWNLDTATEIIDDVIRAVIKELQNQKLISPK